MNDNWAQPANKCLFLHLFVLQIVRDNRQYNRRHIKQRHRPSAESHSEQRAAICHQSSPSSLSSSLIASKPSTIISKSIYTHCCTSRRGVGWFARARGGGGVESSPGKTAEQHKSTRANTRCKSHNTTSEGDGDGDSLLD